MKGKFSHKEKKYILFWIYAFVSVSRSWKNTFCIKKEATCSFSFTYCLEKYELLCKNNTPYWYNPNKIKIKIRNLFNDKLNKLYTCMCATELPAAWDLISKVQLVPDDNTHILLL